MLTPDIGHDMLELLGGDAIGHASDLSPTSAYPAPDTSGARDTKGEEKEEATETQEA